MISVPSCYVSFSHFNPKFSIFRQRTSSSIKGHMGINDFERWSLVWTLVVYWQCYNVKVVKVNLKIKYTVLFDFRMSADSIFKEIQATPNDVSILIIQLQRYICKTFCEWKFDVKADILYVCVFCFAIRLSGVKQNCASILSRNISSLLIMMVCLSKFLHQLFK